MTLKKVSHSEAESYLSCRRKHFYGYIKNGGLKANVSGVALTRGSFVHEILEAYYNVILAAGDTNVLQKKARVRASATARAYYDEKLLDGEYVDEPKPGQRSIEEALFTWYFPNETVVSNGMTVQAVEYKVALEMELDEDTIYQYPFVVDLIALDRDGKTVIIDHKFIYDFYSGDDIDLLTQMPKYLGAFRAGEFPADYAAYNMIRNRSKKDAKLEDAIRFLPVRPNIATVEGVFMEQIALASEIIDIRDGGEEAADATAYRSASTITCNMCDFRDICRSERVGADIRPALAIEFTVKSDKPFAPDLTI
jgi:hypothetical protein